LFAHRMSKISRRQGGSRKKTKKREKKIKRKSITPSKKREEDNKERTKKIKTWSKTSGVIWTRTAISSGERNSGVVIKKGTTKESPHKKQIHALCMKEEREGPPAAHVERSEEGKEQMHEPPINQEKGRAVYKDG